MKDGEAPPGREAARQQSYDQIWGEEYTRFTMRIPKQMMPALLELKKFLRVRGYGAVLLEGLKELSRKHGIK